MAMFERIKDILSGDMQIDETIITPEAELVGDLGLNSLELADLVLSCEDKFGVEISDSDIHTLITVGDIVSYVETKM